MIKSVDEVELKGKNVFLRLDLNVPLDKQKHITDDTRIVEALPTIEYCLAQGAKLLLCSHLGRPDGKPHKEYSLEPVATYLAEKLGRDVMLIEDHTGDGVHQLVRHGQKAGDVAMLENIRFHPGEEANDPEFVRALAHLAEVYVNDAFGASHRKHASIYGLPLHVPETASGFLIAKELKFLNRLLQEPQHPFALVTGGSKVTDKLKALENLLNHVDRIVVGGAMAYAFLAAKGNKIGVSKCEKEGIPAAKAILEKAIARGVKILLPVDHVVAYPAKDPEFKNPSVVDSADVPEGAAALDIGPKTIASFAQAVSTAKTIFWNGPMGFFENPLYAAGTKAVGAAIGKSKATKVAGGGDTLSAIHSLCTPADFDLLSPGGGASLQYLEGRGLPGIDALNKKGGRRAAPGTLNTDEDE